MTLLTKLDNSKTQALMSNPTKKEQTLNVLYFDVETVIKL